MNDSIDFEAEGLADGLDGDAREARLKLLGELAAEGVSLEELTEAVAEGRLALLPVERALAGGGARYSSEEIAEKSGLSREFLEQQWGALGLALHEPDEPAYTERDLEAAKRVALMREGGLSEEGILEVARVLGMTMSQLAAANRTLIAATFLDDGTDEHEVATRLEKAAEMFTPMISELLGHTLNLHLREQIRHDAIASGAGARGSIVSARDAVVCFADMVQFTRLGERLPPEELGAVTGRLTALATAASVPSVRLVKLIGDAAMFVGPEPDAVVETALNLVEAAEAEGDDFPLLRAGVASGEALPRGGDWYGSPVNTASRITDVARPGSVLVAEEVHERLGDDYAWSFAGSRKLKGIDGETKLYRCRRLDADAAP
jgi:adenylate cyclase